MPASSASGGSNGAKIRGRGDRRGAVPVGDPVRADVAHPVRPGCRPPGGARGAWAGAVPVPAGAVVPGGPARVRGARTTGHLSLGGCVMIVALLVGFVAGGMFG